MTAKFLALIDKRNKLTQRNQATRCKTIKNQITDVLRREKKLIKKN